MKKQSDTKYFIPSITNGEYKNDLFFTTLEADIKEDGFFVLSSTKGAVKVYNAEQAFILSNRSLEVENCTNKERVKIDCFPYLKSFIDGYKEGEIDFTNDFKAPPNVIYGENSENYICTILNHFYHTEHETARKGWQFIRFECPAILTHNTIKKYGYYSGIVNKVQELIKQYPNQFKAALDKTKIQTENKKNLSINQIALKYVYEGLTITRQNGSEIASKYGFSSGEKLYQTFNKYYRPTDRTGNPGTLQKLKNKIKLIESVIELLPNDKQARAKDELCVLKTIQNKEYS